MSSPDTRHDPLTDPSAESIDGGAAAPPGSDPVGVATGLYSPLPFLDAEAKYQDGQALETLLLTFNADLGFLERSLLGPVEATGSRLTVVSDAAITDPDPRAVRAAGTRYVVGVADMPGAFHPKIMVIVGPKRAVTAIGSGNLSMGGWQYNSEIWTVATANTNEHPAWLPDVAVWLRLLPDVTHISGPAVDRMLHAADLLDALTATGAPIDTGHRIVHTAADTIMNQLPVGPVDELLLSAPFHDLDLAAIRALIDRFQPALTRIAVQPGSTVTNPTALAALTDTGDVQVVQDRDPGRYRHGKLVEWTVNGQRWTLTGSPNLSRAALLKSISGSGGNCEIGLIAPIPESMFPGSTTVLDPTSQIPVVRITSPDDRPSRPGPAILSATRKPNGLLVALTRPAPPGTVVHGSVVTEDPDTWTEVAPFPPGATSHTIPDAGLPGGSRVRLTYPTEDGARTSTTAFVIDEDQTIRRRLPELARDRRPRYRPDDLFGSGPAAEQFLRDCETVAQALAATQLPKLGHGPADAETSSQGEPRLDSDEAGWLAYLDDAEDRLGPHLLTFALPLPLLPTRQDTLSRARTWEDLPADDRVVGLDDDTADTVVNDDTAPNQPEASSKPEDRSTATEYEKRRYRRWLTNLAGISARLPAMERVVTVRLLLTSTINGIWDDDSWFDPLAEATRSLAVEELRPELEEALGSITATALLLLHQHTHTDGTPVLSRTERTLRYDDVEAAVSFLLPAATEELTTAYAEHLLSIHGHPLHADDVMAFAANVVQDDPMKDAAATLTEYDYNTHSHGPRLLHITGTFTNAILPAHRGLAAVETVTPVGVWAQGTRDWSFLAWDGTHLLRIEQGRSGLRWWHYALPRDHGPAMLAKLLATDPEASKDYIVKNVPLTAPFPEALDMLTALGLPTPPLPPTDC